MARRLGPPPDCAARYFPAGFPGTETVLVWTRVPGDRAWRTAPHHVQIRGDEGGKGELQLAVRGASSFRALRGPSRDADRGGRIDSPGRPVASKVTMHSRFV
jgi:hypothetical protein